MDDQHKYEKSLSAWERERERQKVEFTITEKNVDADLRMPSPEVSPSLRLETFSSFSTRPYNSDRFFSLHSYLCLSVLLTLHTVLCN